MLHIYAAAAQEEARAISARTKAALQAAKSRGVRLGRNGAERLAPANKAAAVERAKKLHPVLADLIASGGADRSAAYLRDGRPRPASDTRMFAGAASIVSLSPGRSRTTHRRVSACGAALMPGAGHRPPAALNVSGPRWLIATLSPRAHSGSGPRPPSALNVSGTVVSNRDPLQREFFPKNKAI
jgi:hypothetical protein